ncbi:unnamed protein product [Cyprideis torosa]|uniref:Uncharacterized protein n=1 Tax=Cyprideis torosa TaxID=163714 RepID=A0A7R8WT50_9CRUS|nr:unnamed protein product [Cyprideis torosa]CAG0905384.1 unnamed protein product [Cyprideis torosa]
MFDLPNFNSQDLILGSNITGNKHVGMKDPGIRHLEHVTSNQANDDKKLAKDSQAKLKNTVNELPNFIRDYIAFHKSSCNKPVYENKYMIFTEKHDFAGGGIGDRLRGLVFTFFWAIATNRTFLIYWDNPFNLTEVFQPATDLDWNCNIEEAFNRSTFFYLPNAKEIAKYSEKFNSGENWPAFTAVQTNYHAMYVPKKYPKPMKELFQREKVSLHSLSLFEIAFNALLKPSKALTQRLMEMRSAIGLKDQQPYITMHLRMGKAGNVTWKDPPRSRPEDIPKLLKCGRKLRRDYSKKFDIPQEELPLVFLTDSQESKQRVAAENSDIRTFDSEIIHIDKHVKNIEAAPKQGYIDAWAEFLLIRESRCIFIPGGLRAPTSSPGQGHDSAGLGNNATANGAVATLGHVLWRGLYDTGAVLSSVLRLH